MKSKKTLVATALVPLLLFSAYVLYGIMNQALSVFPTPDTQSAFLKSYTPETMAARFKCARYSSTSTGGQSASAGPQFATNKKAFDQYFVIKTNDWMPLMTALREDISSQLASHGAHILDQSGDPRDGFKFQYKSGKTLGAVEVEPLKIVEAEPAIGRLSNGRPNPLCPGEAAIEMRVSVQEKYFKKEPGLITTKLTSIPR